MRAQRPNSWSLQQPRHAQFLLLGTALGIGNFFAMPALVLYSGGLPILLAHVASVLLLGLPLVLAEMLWARWLQRDYAASFAAWGPRIGWLGGFAFLAVACLSPIYFEELGRILIMSGDLLSRGGHPNPQLLNELIESEELSFLGGALLALVAATLSVGGPRRVGRAFAVLMPVAVSIWIALAVYCLWQWGGNWEHVLYWDASLIQSEALLRVAAFSLFTLSAGFGIVHTFTFYASQPAYCDKSDSFAVPGSLLRSAALMLVGDLLATALALLWTLPLASSHIGRAAMPQDSAQLLLDWLPQLLALKSGGSAWIVLLHLSLLCSGVAAATSLLEPTVLSFERELGWKRRRATLIAYIALLLLMGLLLFGPVEGALQWMGNSIFLPLSALAICWAAGWRMPLETQRRLWGRSFTLDGLLSLWRVCLRYLAPATLIWMLVKSL